MAEKVLKVSVISPEKILYSGDSTHIRIPGASGSFGVLPNHAPLVSELDVGILEIKNGEEVISMVVEGGFAQVKANVVNVLTTGGDLKKNIDPEKAKKRLDELENSRDKNRDLEIKKAKARILLHKS